MCVLVLVLTREYLARWPVLRLLVLGGATKPTKPGRWARKRALLTTTMSTANAGESTDIGAESLRFRPADTVSLPMLDDEQSYRMGEVQSARPVQHAAPRSLTHILPPHAHPATSASAGDRCQHGRGPRADADGGVQHGRGYTPRRAWRSGRYDGGRRYFGRR